MRLDHVLAFDIPFDIFAVEAEHHIEDVLDEFHLLDVGGLEAELLFWEHWVHLDLLKVEEF